MSTTLVAISPADMLPAQQSLKNWFDARIQTIQLEQSDAEKALLAARKNGFGVKALTTVVNRLARRLRFYGKLKLAVEAGYVLMPALPMTVIAIRTGLHGPRSNVSEYQHSAFRQEAQALAVGAGAYRNPLPTRDSDTTKLADGKTKTEWFPVGWQDDLEMPVELCKPELLDRTQQAMALKLFDEIGVVTDNSAWNRRGDPVIVGTILDPTRRGRRFAFFIAWALPLDDL